MIGLKSIGSYIPHNYIDNIEQGKKFGETVQTLTKKIGASRLPIKSEEQETSDLAVSAVLNLLECSELVLEDIDCLLVVTQNGDGNGLPHTSAVVQNKLGLGSKVAAFDISLGCSGYVYALSILKGFMSECGFTNSVLITADPYSKIIDKEDRVTSLLFGDASTATWLGLDAEWAIGRPLLETDGAGGCHLFRGDNFLSMNGRQVFNFASTVVPKQIEQYFAANNLTIAEIDKVILHQGSAFIVETISRKFPGQQEKFLSDIRNTGNTVSSSIPLLLKTELSNKVYNRLLISGFGVGLSWATNILTRTS